MATKFAYKTTGERQDSPNIFGLSQAKTSSPFGGNGLSRTAMVFKIATLAGHKLTVPEMNRIKDINPRALERVYDTVVGGGK